MQQGNTLQGNAGKVAIIVLTRSGASNHATMTEEQLVEQLNEAIRWLRDNSDNLADWEIEKITVLDNP
jgi:hypothetical protein